MIENDKLTELPYERIAMRGGEMPDGLKWHDKQMFLSLRMLYYQYRIGIVDRETARREKIRLLNDYDFQKWQGEFTAHIATKIKETEEARTRYRKNRTLENADAIILAFDGVPVTVAKQDKEVL